MSMRIHLRADVAVLVGVVWQPRARRVRGGQKSVNDWQIRAIRRSLINKRRKHTMSSTHTLQEKLHNSLTHTGVNRKLLHNCSIGALSV